LPRDPSLTNPRAKLSRAGEHLDALHNDLAAYSERQPHSLGINGEIDHGWKLLRFSITEQPPIRLGLLLGDFIHNLRSALDNLVCQLALLGGAESCNTTQFPICDTPELFTEARERGRLAGVRPEHVASIERFQPYQGQHMTHRALVAVRDFDNIDKHQSIHATLAALDPRPEAVRAERDRLDTEFTMEVRYIAAGKPLYDGAVVACLRGRAREPQPSVNMKIELPIRIGFGEIGLASDKLPLVLRGVELIIESFAPAFEGSS
jgi:hypothetical protein